MGPAPKFSSVLTTRRSTARTHASVRLSPTLLQRRPNVAIKQHLQLPLLLSLQLQHLRPLLRVSWRSLHPWRPRQILGPVIATGYASPGQSSSLRQTGDGLQALHSNDQSLVSTGRPEASADPLLSVLSLLRFPVQRHICPLHSSSQLWSTLTMKCLHTSFPAWWWPLSHFHTHDARWGWWRRCRWHSRYPVSLYVSSSTTGPH